jgi:DNA-binding CsgD family transcriptional regulator
VAAKTLILTPSQERVINALCELGQTDLVARKLKISIRTVEAHVTAALKANKYPNRLMLVLAKDRENR